MENLNIISKVPKFKLFDIENDYLVCSVLDGYLNIKNFEGYTNNIGKYNLINDILKVNDKPTLLDFCRKYKSPPYFVLDNLSCRILIIDIITKINEFKNCCDIVIALQNKEDFYKLDKIIPLIYENIVDSIKDFDTLQLAAGYLNSMFKENLPEFEHVYFKYTNNALYADILPSTVDNLLQLGYYFLYDEIRMGRLAGRRCVKCNRLFSPTKRQIYCKDCQPIRNTDKATRWYHEKGKQRRKQKKTSND